MIRVRTKVRIFCEEGYGDLVEGKDDWGSNPYCYLFLEKGSEGEYDPNEDTVFINDMEVTYNPNWFDIVPDID